MIRFDMAPAWHWSMVVTVIVAVMGLVIWSFMASDAAHRSQRSHELTRLPVSPSF